MVAPRREGSTSAADLERLGPYWLLDRIAEGRLGPVYRAVLRRAGRPDKLLAITRIAPGLQADPAFALRFDALIGEVANIVHPALCAIEDAGEQDGEHYVAAELVTGRDLAQIHGALTQRGQAIPPALVAHIANQIADGLAAAHRATRSGQSTPLCHGELGLSDILIGYDGNVRLTGLGSSALRGFVPALARRGYRAPELERGGVCDARSDVCSLGACMYELLTGASALRDRHSDSAPLPRPQSNITRVVPRTLEPILHRALAEDPNARFQTATELGRELRRWTLAQSAPGDARGLSSFLLTHFDAEREGDEIALRARLERVPADQTVSQPVPTDSGGASRRRPASRSEAPGSSRVRSISPARAGQAVAPQSGPAPAREAVSPRAGRDRFEDLAEHTPPRGQLMNELAATMSGVDSPLLANAANDVSTARPPAAEAARLTWDEETPAHAWISASEEDAVRRNASGANATPSKPAPATRGTPTSRPPAVPSRPPVTTRSSAAPRPRVNTPTPSSQSASAARPIAAPVGAPVPAVAPSVRRAPARRRSMLPGIVMGSIAVIAAIVAAVALLSPRETGPAPSTLQITTHPAGAEVLVQGKRIGVSPLRRDDLPSGKLTLELRKDGFEPLTRTIELMPAQFFQLDVDLSSRKVEVHSEAIAAPAQPADTTASEGAQAEKTDEPRRSARPSWSPGSDTRRKRNDGESGNERSASSAESASDALAELDTDHAAPAAAEQPAAEPPSVAAAPSGSGAGSPSDDNSASTAPAPTAPAAPAPAAQVQRPAAPAPPPAPKGVSRPASVIEQSAPRFPARATRMGISEGAVTLEYTVDHTGAVTQARVVQADPPGVFDDAALRAIEKWRYQPKLDGGKAVDSRLRFTFKFRE